MGRFLDSAGRRFLRDFDYRFYGLLILVAVVLFVLWKRWRYESWPSIEQCINLALSLLAVVGGITVGVVFLLTKPPAIEILPSNSLLIIGLFVPIVSFGYAFPKLRALILPPEAPKPPQT